ncbi:MAG TPA: pyrroline-5-carboxylate reductase [Rudaea sp.]|jgi:pyrroline-5-carboxylate reductase|nr:pyrroline-5-carboxylate reductase [Rudaea sp.]
MTSAVPNIAFIGGGNMARSIIGALIATGFAKDTIAVSEPNADLRERLASDFSVAVHASNTDASRDADVLVLAVKPQMMKTVCADLRDVVQSRKPLVVSIAAGITIRQLDAWLGGDIAIVRCMPNTPALIGAGAAGLCANARVTREQRELAQNILDATGISRWIDDEKLMDTVTALSGSGPAYFFLLVEALEEAAVAQGMPRDVARELATQTCFGAGKMLAASDVDAAELRRRVTSPGGTTQAALESFGADDFNAIVARAVAAATKRGGELSAQMDSP